MSAREITAPDDLGELDEPAEEVAVVGMAGRFPGAANLAELWENLRDGVDAISFFSDAELAASGVDPTLLAHPRYVRARGVLAGEDLFDAPLFGFTPREAAITDPQQRIFLECSYEALEEAGIDSSTYPGRIGVYAGSTLSTYLLGQILALPPVQQTEIWQAILANDRDTLAVRLSYKLNLRGPSVAVQSACSTSLVAVHMARQSLLDYECDVALAGGISIRNPQRVGYLFEEDGILSPDGHCRPFDADARGTVFSSGAGVVVLKRLSDALADGDTVRAVLKGSAVNNDGSSKIGFTAPSVEGQAEVILRAMALAGVHPEAIGYVETHGTGTQLGDPIEVAALTRAFRASTSKSGFCPIGSIKSNLGHCDSASGVAGLIKVVLALEHGEIPPSLHFERPNPRIDFAASPFYVNDRLRPWGAGRPRLAGVSSFGIGGTNAHVVVAEAPRPREATAGRPWQLLVLSAHTETALAAARGRLVEHLRQTPEQDLADVAFTLGAGRRSQPRRQALVASSREDALAAGADRLLFGRPLDCTPSVAFLFPGLSGEPGGVGRELYRVEPVFRLAIDRAAEVLGPLLGEDLRHLLWPSSESTGEEETGGESRPLRENAAAMPALFLPALFALETALARLWLSWGIRPQAMIGHSLGEFVAAHLAGVFSLEDTLALVAARGRLMQETAEGAMAALPLAESEVVPRLGSELSLAAVNGPTQCVVSGPVAAIETLIADLAASGVEARRLPAAHAFHSAQMEPLIEPFTRLASRVALHPPQIPYLSNVTGTWVTAGEATDPAYWAQHLRRTVRFADGLAALSEAPGRVLLEVGPGRTLSRLARRQTLAAGQEPLALATFETLRESLRGENGGPAQPELAALLTTAGRLWIAGVPIDWTGLHGGERRRRVPLPTYPFDRQRHWVALSAVGPARTVAGMPATEAMEPASGAPTEPQSVSEEAAADLGDDPILNRIAAVWREALGVRSIGRGALFFELGGDSLTALQVMGRLRELFPVDLPVRMLFENPSLDRLSRAVEEALVAKLEELPEEEAERLAASYLG